MAQPLPKTEAKLAERASSKAKQAQGGGRGPSFAMPKLETHSPLAGQIWLMYAWWLMRCAHAREGVPE